MTFESASIACFQCFEIYKFGGVGFSPSDWRKYNRQKGTAVSNFSLFIAWGEKKCWGEVR